MTLICNNTDSDITTVAFRQVLLGWAKTIFTSWAIAAGIEDCRHNSRNLWLVDNGPVMSLCFLIAEIMTRLILNYAFYSIPDKRKERNIPCFQRDLLTLLFVMLSMSDTKRLKRSTKTVVTQIVESWSSRNDAMKSVMQLVTALSDKHQLVLSSVDGQGKPKLDICCVVSCNKDK